MYGICLPNSSPAGGRGADVYSFGVVLFELFTREMPFSEVSQMQLTRVKARSLSSFGAGQTVALIVAQGSRLARGPSTAVIAIIVGGAAAAGHKCSSSRQAKGQLPKFPQSVDADITDFVRLCLAMKPSNRARLNYIRRCVKGWPGGCPGWGGGWPHLAPMMLLWLLARPPRPEQKWRLVRGVQRGVT